MKLSSSYASECAKDFTKLALEKELIFASDTPETTAKDIVIFYKTIYEELTGNPIELES